ncbi:hypothetical protein CEXT_479911 [Caerostris extrusa]|uniref:Uncharacterized protein n=1 Tax=Caerostris extrusa TaxID=172846 RepID=A0AAV4MS51_CAEEX|nr:hypothetical protein CEXT_479911 [Caerostris extrusa]
MNLLSKGGKRKYTKSYNTLRDEGLNDRLLIRLFWLEHGRRGRLLLGKTEIDLAKIALLATLAATNVQVFSALAVHMMVATLEFSLNGTNLSFSLSLLTNNVNSIRILLMHQIQ